MASFEIVSLVKEDEKNLSPFCDYWSKVGATCITLYYDGRVPKGFLSKYPLVKIKECDNSFWSNRIADTSNVDEKISYLFTEESKNISAEWKFMLDADEIVAGDCKISDFLDLVPDHIESVSFPTAEAVYFNDDDFNRPFCASGFRTPILGRRWPVRIIGRTLNFLRSGKYERLFHSKYNAKGVLGHHVGKQCARRGVSGLLFNNHFAFKEDRVVSYPAQQVDSSFKMWLLHYDAVSFDRWIEKWQLRASGETTTAPLSQARSSLPFIVRDTLKLGRPKSLKFFKKIYGTSKLDMFIREFLELGFKAKPFKEGSAISNGGKLETKNGEQSY